jgi:hypothetical protein
VAMAQIRGNMPIPSDGTTFYNFCNQGQKYENDRQKFVSICILMSFSTAKCKMQLLAILQMIRAVNIMWSKSVKSPLY